jgi:pyridoxine 5-phosphate synthase
MTAFSANLNKVALLRNTRDNGLPNVVHFARVCIAAGASGITVHPRPDERHTRPGDVRELRKLTRELGVEFNIEGYPAEEFLRLVLEVRPEQCTLVPDAPDQRTSDHGWDVATQSDLLRRVVPPLRAAGIRVSIFMDPTPEAMPLVPDTGAHRIELYTEPYARDFPTSRRDSSLAQYAAAARAAQQLGLGVNAGHDLNLDNLAPFLRVVPNVEEVSIGHALIADALELGMSEAVRRYVSICAESNRAEQSGRSS